MLPSGKEARKGIPVGTYLREYAPDAISYLAFLSWVANEQHNPGEPMHWSRGKSGDHQDCLMRHFLEAGEVDTDGLLHTGKVAWRAIAMLQLEIEDLLKNDINPFWRAGDGGDNKTPGANEGIRANHYGILNIHQPHISGGC